MKKIIQTRSERRRAYVRKHDAITQDNLAKIMAKNKLDGNGGQ